MSKCKFFIKTDEGLCRYYKGQGKEPCNYNCSKVEKIGHKRVNDMDVVVESRGRR